MSYRHIPLVTLMSLSAPAAADPFADLARIEVLPGWRTDAGDHMAGLRITLKPGWKTYWRAPGDAGIPPLFSFAGSGNLAGVASHWPTPEVFDQNGLRSIGYSDSVVFPLTLHGTDADAPIRLTGQIEIGVCEEICIPVTLRFDETLPLTGSPDTAITAALISEPLTGAEAGIGAVVCTVSPISDGLQVTATIELPGVGQVQAVVIEPGNPAIWVSDATVSRDGDSLKAKADMVHTSGNTFLLDRSAVRITVLAQDQAIDIQGCDAG